MPSRRHGQEEERREQQRGAHTGTGLNRATMIGHVAAPMPQQKLSAPSADAARSGVSRATIRLVVGTTKPSPMPATAIAIVPATRSPSARPARPADINAYPVESVALAPSARDDQPRQGAGHDAAGKLNGEERARGGVGQLPPRGQPRQHRAEDRRDEPVTTKPAKRSGRPLRCT